MKLAMSDQSGVWILTGTGDISEHDIQVLKAGLTKLFNSGKNKIVIDLPESERIPPEMLREIARLDITARELSGRIVLAGINARLREQIAQFAMPPVVECVESKEAAVKKLLENPAEKAAPAMAAAAPAAPAAAPAAKGTAAPAAGAPEAATQYKADIRQKELGESGELRKRVEKLQKQNELLIDQLKTALQAKRVPPGDAALRSEIASLEEKIAQLLGQRQGKKS
jgi:anti-anti-sigma regulatory factor